MSRAVSIRTVVLAPQYGVFLTAHMGRGVRKGLTPLRRELFFALAGLTYYFLTSSSVVALKALSTALLPLDAPYEGLSFAIVSCMGLLATILCASAEGACRCEAPRPRWPSPNCRGDLGASPKIEGLFRRHKVRVCRTENIC